jgi:hypothetical chaperone protein
MSSVLGVDFGTTNTVLSFDDGEGGRSLITFPMDGVPKPAFRSVLSFREEPNSTRPRSVEAGAWAIDEYLEDPLDTRFIQSFKTFAASHQFQSTTIFDRRYTFEDLLFAFLARVRHHGGEALKTLPETVIIGRPVQFAGAAPDADLALERYDSAFQRLGFVDRHYVYEPAAAAFYFAQTLVGTAVVLVADFGGGTSDFSVIRFDRTGGQVTSTPLSHSGVGVAGDAFDYRIIDHIVSPRLGKGSTYRSFENVLPVPNKYYAAFARWSQLALLKTSRELVELRALVRATDTPALADFVELIEDDHGYPLYRAVSATKEGLSVADEAPFAFEAGRIDIKAQIKRSDFEAWIKPELDQIQAAVDRAVTGAGLANSDIDQVFLTGGSSFVPAVRRIFSQRFGDAAIASGGEFESIASGLSLIGQDDNLDQWSQSLD